MWAGNVHRSNFKHLLSSCSCFEAAHLAGFGPKKTSMACLPGRKKSRGAAGGDFPMEQQLEHLFPELLRKVWDHLGSTRQVIAAVTPVSKALRDVLFATMTSIKVKPDCLTRRLKTPPTR